MAQIENKNGDILSSGAPLIIHQVNCMGVMGAGLAKQIREKYPEVFPPYQQLCAQVKNKQEAFSLLGKAQPVEAKDGTIIINLFGQVSYGTIGRRTDYAALATGLNGVVNFAIEEDIPVVALPYKLGCGLAGGSWDIVYNIIREEFEAFDGTVQIWKL